MLFGGEEARKERIEPGSIFAIGKQGCHGLVVTFVRAEGLSRAKKRSRRAGRPLFLRY
jgi:hypothetical protein